MGIPTMGVGRDHNVVKTSRSGFPTVVRKSKEVTNVENVIEGFLV